MVILKIIFGLHIKSVSITADGFHSLSEGYSNVVGLIGIRYASKPVDMDHPYGYRKIETLVGLFICVMLVLVGINIAVKSFQRFFNMISPNITFESIIVMLVALCISIFISWVEYREGRKFNIQVLISDSLHTRSDIYVSIGVLVTLICIKIGLPAVIDPIASVIVAGFIFHAAYKNFKETNGVLVDKAVVDSEKIKKITLSFSDVKNVHQIRSRGYVDDSYIDFHIMIEPTMSVEESHRLIHSIESKMKVDLNVDTQIIVHSEPYYSSNNI